MMLRNCPNTVRCPQTIASSILLKPAFPASLSKDSLNGFYRLLGSKGRSPCRCFISFKTFETRSRTTAESGERIHPTTHFLQRSDSNYTPNEKNRSLMPPFPSFNQLNPRPGQDEWMLKHCRKWWHTPCRRQSAPYPVPSQPLSARETSLLKEMVQYRRQQVYKKNLPQGYSGTFALMALDVWLEDHGST